MRAREPGVSLARQRRTSVNEVTYPYPGAAHAAAYELLNQCTDPEHKVERVINGIAPWQGKIIVDIGAGSGFHSVRLAEEGAHVIGIEPDPRLRQQMFDRLKGFPDRKISLLAAGAENIPLCSDYADMAYARFAYFFGTSACLSGLAEVMRVLKPGGNFFIVDVIPEWGTWGTVARKAYPSVFHPNYHADQSRFYASHGFATHRVETVFRAPDRETMKTVFQMDFPKAWEELLQDVRSLELSYGIAVFHQQKH